MLHKQYYLNGHVTEIAQRLLGAYVWTNVESKVTVGRIVEVEAYSGTNDRACHANNGRRTKRNEVMYAEGGMAYVYLCYGIHWMLNVVTNVAGIADAVLVRAIEPVMGIEYMLERRGAFPTHRIGAGPGNVCKALGISKTHNGLDLRKEQIWLTRGEEVREENIIASTRIGVAYALEDALLPWRFYIKGNTSVSKK